MKPCPRGGAFDFEISQIPTLPHLIPSRPGGGGGLILIGALNSMYRVRSVVVWLHSTYTSG